MSSAWRSLLLSACLLLSTETAWAHPHAWIDLRSKVLLDGEGRVQGLELAWLFDDYYTVLMAEELGDGAEPSDEFLDKIAARNLSNLRDYDYFTAIHLDGERQAVGEVTRYETELHDGRLWMRFELPLEQSVDPRAGEFTFSVYDPTYWIEIVHLEGDPILFSGESADRCIGKIRQPNPTLEQVSLATALDQDESAGDGLGVLFAETVVISCD